MGVLKVINRFIIITALATTLSIFAFVKISYADQSKSDINWVGSTLKYDEYPDQDLFPPKVPGGCISQVMNITVSGNEEKEATVCLNQKDDWSYGSYYYREPTWWGGSTYVSGYVALIGDNGPMHRMISSPSSDNISVPNSDSIIMLPRRADINSYFEVFNDFNDKLREVIQQDGEIQYTFDRDPDLRLEMPDGGDVAVYNKPGISNNGKWAVVETGIGFLRINLETLEVKRFTDLTYTYTIGLGPSTEFAISNDGKHVAVMGRRNPNLGSHPGYRLYDVTNTCGDYLDGSVTNYAKMEKPCPETSFESVARDNQTPGPSFEYAVHPMFDDDGGQLTLELTSSNREYPAKWIQLTVDGYTSPPHITYLALGDSYSSGEGDIVAGNTHYLEGTDDKHGCHLSNRSYPFLLKDYYDIMSENMQSVACSGARVFYDYMGDSENYIGQSEQLKGLANNDKNETREKALNDFSPGYVKQIDFIKKYKPDIVTFTGGGNDVGFIDVLKYCNLHLACDYSRPGSHLSNVLYGAIDFQYDSIRVFADQIKRVSPDTQIVMVGYPSFIADDYEGACAPIYKGLLSREDARMINNALERLNSVIQAAAYETGSSFVDVENALVGGRICEDGSKYVNSIFDVGISNSVFGGDPSSFHPNPEGHRLIARVIEESGVFTSPKIPENPNFVKGDYERAKPNSFIKNGLISIGNTVKIVTEGGFMNGTTAHFKLFSDPIDLGTYQVDEKGGLEFELNTHNLPTGGHVLVANGTDIDGEAVEYYQFIDIVEPEKNDKTEPTSGDGHSGKFDETKAKEATTLKTAALQDQLADFMIENFVHQSQDNHKIGVGRADIVTDQFDIPNLKKYKNTRQLLIMVTIACIILITSIGAYIYAKSKKHQ